VNHPVSLYAATKRANELMAHTYSHLYRMPTTGLRFFTAYGPWGRPDMAYFSFTNAILEGTTIEVFNHGDMSRDFTYIDDIIEGLIASWTASRKTERMTMACLRRSSTSAAARRSLCSSSSRRSSAASGRGR
jgi:nucleoside-diphosphate-sugar epimerase